MNRLLSANFGVWKSLCGEYPRENGNSLKMMHCPENAPEMSAVALGILGIQGNLRISIPRIRLYLHLTCRHDGSIIQTGTARKGVFLWAC